MSCHPPCSSSTLIHLIFLQLSSTSFFFNCHPPCFSSSTVIFLLFPHQLSSVLFFLISCYPPPFSCLSFHLPVFSVLLAFPILYLTFLSLPHNLFLFRYILLLSSSLSCLCVVFHLVHCSLSPASVHFSRMFSQLPQSVDLLSVNLLCKKPSKK